VFATAAAVNLGVKNLMNELMSLMPSAADMPAVEAKDKSGKAVEVKRDLPPRSRPGNEIYRRPVCWKKFQ
jgi:hypothetical protein